MLFFFSTMFLSLLLFPVRRHLKETSGIIRPSEDCGNNTVHYPYLGQLLEGDDWKKKNFSHGMSVARISNFLNNNKCQKFAYFQCIIGNGADTVVVLLRDAAATFAMNVFEKGKTRNIALELSDFQVAADGAVRANKSTKLLAKTKVKKNDSNKFTPQLIIKCVHVVKEFFPLLQDIPKTTINEDQAFFRMIERVRSIDSVDFMLANDKVSLEGIVTKVFAFATMKFHTLSWLIFSVVQFSQKQNTAKQHFFQVEKTVTMPSGIKRANVELKSPSGKRKCVVSLWRDVADLSMDFCKFESFMFFQNCHKNCFIFQQFFCKLCHSHKTFTYVLF